MPRSELILGWPLTLEHENTPLRLCHNLHAPFMTRTLSVRPSGRVPNQMMRNSDGPKAARIVLGVLTRFD